MELLNDADFEWSLDQMFKMTKVLDASIEQLRNEGYSSEEIDNILQPQYSFREGMIEDLMIYRDKKKSENAGVVER